MAVNNTNAYDQSLYEEVDASDYDANLFEPAPEPPGLLRRAAGTVVNALTAAAGHPISAEKKEEPPSYDTNLYEEDTQAEAKASRGPEPGLSSVVAGLSKSLPQGAELARQGIRLQFADLIGSEEMRQDAMRKYEAAQTDVALSTPEFESSTASGIYGGGSSILRTAPGVAASIATRSAAPVLATMGVQTEAEAYGKYRSRDAEPGEAALGAFGEGATEVLTEVMPMGFLVKNLGKVGAGKFLGGLLAREVPSEQVATVVQDALDTAIANPDKTWEQYAKERPDAAYQTLLATLVQAGLMEGVHVAAQRIGKTPPVANVSPPGASPSPPPSAPPGAPIADQQTGQSTPDLLNRFGIAPSGFAERVDSSQPPPAVMGAQTVDEAIAAAQAHVDAPVAPGLGEVQNVANGPTIPDIRSDREHRLPGDVVGGEGQATAVRNPGTPQIAVAQGQGRTGAERTNIRVSPPLPVFTPGEKVNGQPVEAGVRVGSVLQGTDVERPSGVRSGVNRVTSGNVQTATTEVAPRGKQQAKTDDLIRFIAKNGGLNREAAKAEGLDPAHFNDSTSRQVFGKPLFPRAGGLTMDGLAELMSQAGYLPGGQYHANDALDVVTRALRGEEIYSPQDVAKAYYNQQVAEREEELARAAAAFEKAVRSPRLADQTEIEAAAAGMPEYDEPAGQRFEPGEYPPDMGGEARSLIELHQMAKVINEDMADEVLERAGDDIASQQEAARRFDDIIRSGRGQETDGSRQADGEEEQRSAPQAPAPTAQTPQEVAPGETADLLGGKNATAQAVKDAEVERQRKMAAAPAMESGAGDLFTERSKQTEIPATKHDYSSSQVALKGDDALRFREAVKRLIEASDIDPTEGLEDRPHITVKYGLHTANASDLADVLKGEGPITATVAGIDIFQPDGKDYDVVVQRVTSPDLTRLNKKVSDSLEHTDTHPVYRPHITLGYVKKGLGQKYADAKTGLEGRQLRFNTVEFASKNEKISPIELKPTGGLRGEVASIEARRATQRPGERRHDVAERTRVGDMTPEQMQYELLRDFKTGLYNERAYHEHAKLPVQVAVDLDGLKWVNDTLGHQSGDVMIKAMGEALLNHADFAYRVGGDEFYVQANNEAEAKRIMEAVDKTLSTAIVSVKMLDGSTITKRGVTFSYGYGKDAQEAESGLKASKLAREISGLRARRGVEPPGVVKESPAGQQDNGGQTAGGLSKDEALKLREAASNPANAEGALNVILANAKILGDAVKSEAFRIQGFRGLDVPTQDRVLKAMGGLSENLKIVDAVVPLIPVHMMDVLRSKQFTPQMLLHDKAMLRDLLTSGRIGGVDVGLRSPVGGNLIRALANIVAKGSSLDSVSTDNLRGTSGNEPTTLSTGDLNRSSLANPKTNLAATDVGGLDVRRPFSEVLPADETGTINLRHDVTPSGDVGLGAVGDETLTAPPIIHQPTVADIHALADRKSILWNNDPAFLKFTESVTGKEHLDDLSGSERKAVYDALDARAQEQQPLLSRSSGQTNTPEFKRWFGDSKVVDESGKPLVVYHGTYSNFTVFDSKKQASVALGAGFYFAEDKSVAESAGDRVMPVYLGIKRPLVLSSLTDPGRAEWNALFESDPAEAQDKAVSEGYDGILDDFYTDRQWVAFHPEQIKSAISNRGTFDPNNPDILASRQTEPAAGGFSASEARKAIAPIVAKWTNGPEINVVQSVEDLPSHLQDSIRATDAEGNVEGLFDPRTESIFLVADNIKDANRSQQVIFHEAVGHFGLRGLLGEDLNPLLRQVYLSYGRAGLKDIADLYGLDLNTSDGRLTAAEEKLARIAETGEKPHLLQRLYALIRDWLRRMGFDIKLNDADLKAIIARAGKFLEGEQNATASAEQAPAYSLRPEDINGLASKARSEIGNLLESDRTFNRWWHKTVGTQFHKAQVDKDFGKVFNFGQDYLTDFSRYAMMAESEAPDLLTRMEGLRDVFRFGAKKADVQTVSSTIFEGTLDEKVFSEDQLKDRGLTDKQIEYYGQARAAIGNSLDELAKSIMAKQARAIGIDGSFIDGLRRQDTSLHDFHSELLGVMKLREKGYRELAKGVEGRLKSDFEAQAKAAADQIKATVNVFNRAAELKSQGYAPLMRFGQYTVSVSQLVDGEREEVFFGMYETQAAANRAAQELAKEFPNTKIEKGILSQEAWRVFRGVSPETIAVFAQAVGLDQDAAFQDYLKLAVNSRSAMKRMIHRKGTPGFSEDLQRVLAAFITSNARLTSSNYHLGDMQKAVDLIPREKGDVKDEAVRLWQYLIDPKEEAGKLRGFLFFNFLGGSVASGMVNATQPIMITAPYLAQFTSVKNVSTELGVAMKDAVLNEAPEDMATDYQRAVDEGIIAPHEIYQLMAAARNSIGRSTAIARGMRVWGAFFSLAEAFNRRTTFIAAYRIAKKLGKADPYEFAKQAIYETQFIYNKGCVDDTTECLTASGWKKHDALQIGETVYAVDSDGALVESRLIDVHKYTDGPFDATEFRNNNGFSMVLTPEHKCLIQNYNSRDEKWQRQRLVRADTIKKSNHIVRVPISDRTERKQVYSDDEVALFAWVASEGHYAKFRNCKKRTNVRITQSVKHNQRYVEEIEQLLTRLGGHYKKFLVRGEEMATFTLKRPLSDSVRVALPNKMISFDLVGKLTVSQMVTFLNTFTKGDGHFPDEGGNVITQKAICNLQALQAMAVLSGNSSTLYERMGRHDFGVLYIAKNSKRAHCKAITVTPVKLDMVWCPQTEHGTWIARRNGRTFVTGNSRPDWARGAPLAVIFTFKQFSISYIEAMKRMPPAQRAMALMLLWFMTGLKGLPFADDLGDVVDTIGQWLGYDTNSDKWLRKIATKTLGNAGAEFMLHGATALPGVPLDLQARFSMGNLIPGTSLLKPSETNKTRDIQEFLGPAGGVAGSIGGALESAAKGDAAGAVRTLLPTSVQSALKGMDMWETGQYRDTRGRKVRDVSKEEAILKMAGFQPSEVAKESRIIRENQQDINLQHVVEAGIADKWATGIVEHDKDKIAAARQEMKDWNAKNPETRVMITPQQIERRVIEMRKTKGQRFKKSVPPEMRGRITREMREAQNE